MCLSTHVHLASLAFRSFCSTGSATRHFVERTWSLQMLRITLSCIPRSCNDAMQEWQVHRKQWLTTSRWVDASEELEEGLRSGSKALPVGDTKASMPNPFARTVSFGSVKDWFSRDTEAFAGFCTYLLNRDEQVEVHNHIITAAFGGQVRLQSAHASAACRCMPLLDTLPQFHFAQVLLGTGGWS